MTKNEIQKIKEEIKKELKVELKNEILKEINKSSKQPQNLKGIDFDFTEYKKEVVHDDIKKIQEFIATKKKIWFVPLIGMCVYLYDFTQALASIDRGILRQNINKASLKWLWLDIPFLYTIPIIILFNYMPWRTRAIMRKAIELTKGNEGV